MKLIKPLLIFISMGVFAQSGSALADASTQSQQAIQQGGIASVNASGSAAHAIAASGQVTSAVAAVPLASGGVVSAAAGLGSAEAANASAQSANASLEIGDETITAMPPPNEALRQKAETPRNGN